MTQKNIIGRVAEQALLKEILVSKKSEFLAIYGRRRVGKTFLIKNFFENQELVFFYVSGLQDGSIASQTEEFYKQIGKTFYSGASVKSSARWKDAFEELTKAINQISKNKKVVLFLDELPWLATPRSGLLQALDYYWNRYWSHDERLKLIICGSSASWIIEKIINNKGGLHNRVTRTMVLRPFSLFETKSFLAKMGFHYSHEQVLELYMIFGGVPHYLALMRKNYSVAQSVDELFFQKDGGLVHEFKRLFSSLFNDAEHYTHLIRAIAKYRYGIGQAALIRESGALDSGRTKQRLRALEEAGFIVEFTPYGHQSRGLYYKVIDEFTLFFLRWVEPHLKAILKQDRGCNSWLSKLKSPHWNAWAGLSFESVCYKHLPHIRKVIKIPDGSETSYWRYFPQSQEDQGVQIDLLFARPDDVTTICEIKYNEKPFSIDKEYAKKLSNKLKIYKRESKIKNTLFLVMVTVHGLKPSIYSEEMVHGVSTLDDLFKDL